MLDRSADIVYFTIELAQFLSFGALLLFEIDDSLLVHL